MFKPGAQARLHVPKPFPSDYTHFREPWVDFVKGLDGQLVELVSPDTLGLALGWRIKKEIVWVGGTSPTAPKYPWVPLAWLFLESSKTICDCPLSLVMRSGCQNKDHE